MIKYYNGEMYTIPKEFEEETRADEGRKICQMVKDNNGLIEGKDGMVVTTQEDFEYILAETESTAMRKFAKWLAERVGFECADCVLCGHCKEGTCVGNLLDEYRKEHVHERNTH